jgi:hypothetical protein
VRETVSELFATVPPNVEAVPLAVRFPASVVRPVESNVATSVPPALICNADVPVPLAFA